MAVEIDETAAERDFEIKLGFGAWLLFVWAIPLSYGVIWFAILTISTLLRGLMLLLANGLDSLALYRRAKGIDDAARWVGRTPVYLAPLLIFAALGAAFYLRDLYRRQMLASSRELASQYVEKREPTEPTKKKRQGD
jgi:hypothetical protein